MFSRYVVTLCNTDLENQELEFTNYEEAKEVAERLSFFLPKSFLHTVLLEGVISTVIHKDEDGCESFSEERITIAF